MAVLRDPPQCGRCRCDAQHLNPYGAWIINGEEYRTCPRYLLTERSLALLMLYSHYRRGLLPFPGALYDQPHAYLEAMELIETHINGDDSGTL